MSYEKLRKKKKSSKKLTTLLIVSIILTIIIKSLPSILAKNTKTLLAEKGELIDTISGQGIIIKDEQVTKAKLDGSIDKFAKEGERVSAGSLVLTLNSVNDSSSLKLELSQIEEAIQAIKDSENEIKSLIGDGEKVLDTKYKIVDDIQASLNMGDYKDAYLLKDKLSLINERTQEVKIDIENSSLESLENRKTEILDSLNTNHMKYYSSSGGIVSYKIDGYEDLLNPNYFDEYFYESFDFIDDKNHISDRENVSLNQGIYKLIDNFEWYMAIKIEDIEALEGLNPNTNTSLIIGKEKKELKGRIVKVNNSDQGGLVIVKLTTDFQDYYMTRLTDVKLVRSKKEGYKILNSSIAEDKGIKGVFIKDKSNIVRFRPVNIIGQDNNYSYVEIGDANGYIKLEASDKAALTIGLYDEIFTTTKNVKDGQILN